MAQNRLDRFEPPPELCFGPENERCDSGRLDNKVQGEEEKGHGCHDCLNRWVLVSRRIGTTYTFLERGNCAGLKFSENQYPGLWVGNGCAEGGLVRGDVR